MSFLNRRKWRFHGTQISESTEYLANPGCGWCRIYTFSLDKEIDFEELYWCLQKRETLVQAVVLIGAFRKQEIPQEALHKLAQILQFFTEHDKQMILRFAYDGVGQGLMAEPDEMELILTHMKQIGPLLRSYENEILVLQGLFIGSWGEMHSSKFLSKEKLRHLAETLRESVGDQIPVAVRTPLQWRMLHKRETEPGGSGFCVFNDGMFGSDLDLGTYGTKQRESAEWEEGWNRTDELAFLGRMHKKLPYGGEAVGLAKEGRLKEAVLEMKQTHLCYLNAVHDEKCLNRWKKSVWEEKGIWKGMNGYDYIGAHLGFRPVIRKITGKTISNGLHLEIILENAGFAYLPEDAEVVVTVKEEGREPGIMAMPLLQEDFKPDASCRLACQFPEEKESGEYRVFVGMRRKRDGHPLFLANGQEHENVLVGLFSDL